MKEISVTELYNSKVHFGHLKRFVSPKMFKYIHMTNNKISIINLDLTLTSLKNALNFIESIFHNNGTILFVGTKRQASNFIKKYAEKVAMPYVNFRWLGGSLTNYKTIKKSILNLKDLEEKIDQQQLIHLTKKEILNEKKKLKRLRIKFEGIKNMDTLPNALFVIDVGYEKNAVFEAKKLGIPVIGIVDSNCNPDNIDYVIPGNDDSPDAINFYLNIIADHITNIKLRINKYEK